MDQLTARYRVQEAQGLLLGRAETGAEEILINYEALVEAADKIAELVWYLRWPNAGYKPSFEISFSERYHDKRTVTAGFSARSDNDSFEFPIDYLWMSYEEIITAEDILKYEKHAEELKKKKQYEDNVRYKEIGTLKSLMSKYPEVALQRADQKSS